MQPHNLAITTIKILVDFFLHTFFLNVLKENTEKEKEKSSVFLPY